MPLLDLELARRITEGIAYLLSRWAPDAQPWPEDRSAPEFAEKLRRRDPREIIYLREAIEPCWPHFRSDDDPNRERVFVRVAVKGERVEFASAVFTGSLVHWEAASADVYGELTWLAMDPDQHLAMRLEAAETLLREMGLTLIPPAAMSLTFGKWSLAVLLDPRMQNLREAGEDVGRLADLLQEVKGAGGRYKQVLDLLRKGYDLGTLENALAGRSPVSMAEVTHWLSERPPPFAWTRPVE